MGTTTAAVGLTCCIVLLLALVTFRTVEHNVGVVPVATPPSSTIIQSEWPSGTLYPGATIVGLDPIVPRLFRGSSQHWLQDKTHNLTVPCQTTCSLNPAVFRGELLLHRQNRGNLYAYYDKNAPDTSETPHGGLSEHSSTSANATEMCGLIESETKHAGPWYYFSSDIKKFPACEWSHHEILIPELYFGTPQQVNVWSGSQGIVAQTHYDSSYNFFTQLCGIKVFTLWPPSSHAQLQLFSSLHPNARHSRLDSELELVDPENGN
eukprot:TRINITY_DN47_c0_g1_i1.p1 TRINITY_DN47_c0_g1~~TRINITY_DN47_c0_g1_i1.p1  ORF type:complete len:264 (+),score=3.18 TRINITY_DN47_c0_g1_i1:7064-7855(+)